MLTGKIRSALLVERLEARVEPSLELVERDESA